MNLPLDRLITAPSKRAREIVEEIHAFEVVIDHAREPAKSDLGCRSPRRATPRWQNGR